MRNFIKRLLKQNRLALSRYSEHDLRYIERMGWQNLSYKEFEILRALSYEGHISLKEAKFLAELVGQTDPAEPIIEIGTLFGYSTTVLAQSKATSQKLITVDAYLWNPLGLSPETHQLATSLILEDARKNHNVEIVAQDKRVFYQEYRGPAPALFFCDAHHDYEPTLEDLKWAKKIGAKIICGHDYDETLYPGVVRAVQALGGARQVVQSLFVL